MGKFVNQILVNNERVVYETRPHWSIYLLPALLVPLVVGIPLLIKAALDRRSSEFVVTDRRVIVKTGIISRDVFEINLSKVESARVSQSVFDRMLGCGTISITGTGGSSPSYYNIDDPLVFKRKIDELVAQSR